MERGQPTLEHGQPDTSRRVAQRWFAQAALDQRPLPPDDAHLPGSGPVPYVEDGSVAQGFSRPALIVLACGSLIVLLSFGIRSSFGLFLQPMSLDLGWGREVFALAIALQNLIWGVAQPFAGALEDRYGAGRTIAGGGVLYVLGVYLMAASSTPAALYLGAGVLIGLGLSGTGFGVVLAAVARSVAPERRSAVLGITTALGSLGQFLMPPIGQAFLETYGWQTAFVALQRCGERRATSGPPGGGLARDGRGRCRDARASRRWWPR